jgi:hypothetical protein
MNMDDLRREWRERDQALEASLKLNRRLLRETWVTQQSAGIRDMGWVARFEMLTWVPSILLLGWFNARHLNDWHFLIPGVALQVWVTLVPILSILERTRLRAVDLAQPVTTLQYQFEVLTMRRLTTLKWAFLTGQVVWYVPFLLVLFKGLFGVNLYAVSPWIHDQILIHIAVGIALIPLAVLLSRWLGKRLAHEGWFQRLTDNLAGHDIMEAKAFLQRLRGFEREIGEEGGEAQRKLAWGAKR